MSDKIKPLRNIKLTIEYDGTNYCGWQVQKSHKVTRSQGHKSIQEVIEKALHKITQQKVRLIASGRTDAGVHALAQVANFKSNSLIPAEKLQKALNATLPDDIIITQARETTLDFHSRFSCCSKVYQYLILNQPFPSVFFRGRAYFYPYPLDVQLMRKAARYLRGRHDFSSFCASASSARDRVRTIKRLSIKRQLGSRFSVLGSRLSVIGYQGKSNLIVIEVEADGFLYNMVRSIVGTLLEIGRKKINGSALKKIISAKDRRTAGPTAPSQGLYLARVNYS